MKMRIPRLAVAALLFSGLLAAEARAQAADAASKEEAAKPKTAAKEEWSITEHTIVLGSETVPYKASAGTTIIRDDEGEPTGLIYSVSYTRSDIQDPNGRPVSFLYNGGPGSSTMWLHMGAFGPRRVLTVNGEFTGPAPYSLVDNGECLLDKTDLVFIDAMGTGYSRAAGKAKEKDFYGVDEDADAFARFITTYLTKNDRWNSPKFLIGESYGTFRSAVLANLLQSRYSVHLNGVCLISSVLDLSTLTFSPGDDRPYIYYLPSYAVTAWYHKALENQPPDLEAFIEESRQYAQGDYADALAKGSFLTDEGKSAVAAKLSEFTGLSREYLIKANLRVKLGQFMAELLRDRGLTAGRIDSRFTGYTYDLLTEDAEGDPEGPAVAGAFTALINRYNHTELKFGQDKVYNPSRIGRGWNWNRGRDGEGRFFPGAPNAQADLARAMVMNPNLLVQVENGYYDMATPFHATEYTMSHLGLPAQLQSHIQLNYYNAGHMMYLRDGDRVTLHDNIAAFIERAAGK